MDSKNNYENWIMSYTLILNQEITKETVFCLDYQQHLILCVNKKDISWIQKIIMKIGFGRFNLSNVASKLIDAKIQLNQNQKDKETFVDSFFEYFKKKAESYNQKSFLRTKVDIKTINLRQCSLPVPALPPEGNLLEDPQSAIDYINQMDLKFNYTCSEETDENGISIHRVAGNPIINWDDSPETIVENLYKSLWCLQKNKDESFNKYQSKINTLINLFALASKQQHATEVNLNTCKDMLENAINSTNLFDARAVQVYKIMWLMKKYSIRNHEFEVKVLDTITSLLESYHTQVAGMGCYNKSTS